MLTEGLNRQTGEEPRPETRGPWTWQAGMAAKSLTEADMSNLEESAAKAKIARVKEVDTSGSKDADQAASSSDWPR